MRKEGTAALDGGVWTSHLNS